MHTLPAVTPDVLYAALAAGRVGVWTLDTSTGCSEWSEAMARLHGVDGLCGAAGDVFEAVESCDRAAIDEAVAHAPDLDEPLAVEYRLLLPDGRTRWLSAIVCTATGAQPDSVAVCVFATDVTERKEHDLAAARRRTSIEGLHWVNRAIIAGQGLGDTADALVHSASDVLGATAGILVYAAPDDNGGSLARAVAGIPESDAGAPRRLDWPEGIVGVDDVITVDDVSSAGVGDFLVSVGFPPETVRACGSALLVPIGSAARLGAMCFIREDVGYFSTHDAELASAIGSTAKAAIESAQRYEEQRLAARTFQQHLLPQHDVEIAGVELCTKYHPGRDGLDVGGDWFDVIDLGGRIGLAVGDVCGHGLVAAAHMGQLRYSFRALVRASSTPEKAFGVLNRIALDLHTTATVAYVELDVHTGACAIWRCGHLPPVIASAGGGTARWLGELGDGGPMLGFVDDVTCRPIRTNLDRGDVLLLYTDGLVERRGELIDDGLDRLAAALADSLPIEVLDDRCGALYQALARMGPDADDIAMVAARRH